jgi:flagellar motility protein MotE (MotC chaperone)
MCFCHYYYHTMGGNAGPTQKAMHVFVGLESNVTTAKEMARFVVESVNREAQRYQRYHGLNYADYRAFAQGAAAKIRLRCADIERQAKEQGVGQQAVDADDHESLAQSGAGTALVLASLYKTEEEANKQWLEDRNIKLGNGRSQSIDLTRGYAHRAGAEYGSKVSLNRQVGGSSRKQLK